MEEIKDRFHSTVKNAQIKARINIFPEKRRLKQRKGVYYQRKLKQKLKDVHDGVLEFDQLETSVAGWVNHVRYGNTVGLRKAILKDVIVPSNK